MFLTPPKINRPSRSPLPASPGLPSPGTGWGFSFQNFPSTHVEEPLTAPVIPTSLLSKSKQALSNVSGAPGSPKHTALSQTSSDLSSDNSLSTPPAQPRRFLTPIYGPVGLPPVGPGTGRIAPVSLPTQTPGTGRTNPVTLPPTQQPQQPRNPDGLPPPGATNEPPTPTTTTSTRGRGTGNRGKKRR